MVHPERERPGGGAPVTPLLTVDVVVELVDRPGRPFHPVVLVRRAHPPPGWALPGGFVEVGERVEEAAVREAREETGLEVTLRALLGVYSDPARDPRGHTVSVVYVGTARGEPRGMDDAREAAAFTPPDWPSPLAFDHALILEDYLAFLRTGRPASPAPAGQA